MTTTDIAVDVARQPDIERWLDDHDITWTYDPAFPIGDVDHYAGLANQARLTPLDEDTVDRYVADMADGATFPAVILRRVAGDRIPIGGNHRLAAARRAGRTTHAAYIVDVDPEHAHLLAIEDNRRHGLPLTQEERLWHAVELTSTMTVEDAAGHVGLPVQTLRRQLAANRCTRRAVRLDLDGFTDLSTTTKSLLDQLADDRVFTKTLELVTSGAVLASEVAKLVSRLNTLDARAAIDELAAIRRDTTGRVRRGVGRPPSPTTSPRRRFLGDTDALIAQLHPEAIAANCHDDDERAQVLGQVHATARWLIAVEKAITRA